MRAPKARRMGWRMTATRATAAPAARLNWMRPMSRSAGIFDPRDQGLQFGDVGVAELLAFGKLREQRPQAPLEQPVDEALGFGMDIVGAGDQRPEQIAPALLGLLDRL